VKFRPLYFSSAQKIWLFTLLISFFSALAQEPQETRKKGSGAGLNSTVSNLDHGPCLHKNFSLVFYIFKDSTFSLCCNQINTSIPQTVNALNKIFAPICVSFSACSTVVIPNYSLGEWDYVSMSNGFIANYHTDNTINVYIPEFMSSGVGTDPAASTYPPPNVTATGYKDAIILSRSDIFIPASTSTLGVLTGTAEVAHVFGHFFGLPHTFDEINPGSPANPPPPVNNPPINSKEWAKRTNGNCYTHGDGFCDTEADPFPARGNPAPNYRRPHMDNDCFYIYGLKDGFNDPYFPPVDNYMSNYPCRCRFSQEQYNFMAEFIKNNRLHLH
jgi:hypothetical protein